MVLLAPLALLVSSQDEAISVIMAPWECEKGLYYIGVGWGGLGYLRASVGSLIEPQPLPGSLCLLP